MLFCAKTNTKVMKKHSMTKFSDNYFAKNLSVLRKNKNVSQVEMAEMLGLARTTYASYEAGRSEPGIPILLQLSEFFSISINDMCLKNLKNEKYDKINVYLENNDNNIDMLKSTEFNEMVKEFKKSKKELEESRMKIEVLEETLKTTIHKIVDNLSKEK